MNEEILIEAHKHSSNHRKEILKTDFKSYSYFNTSIGLVVVVLTAWKLTVIIAINMVNKPARIKVQSSIGVL